MRSLLQIASVVRNLIQQLASQDCSGQVWSGQVGQFYEHRVAEQDQNKNKIKERERLAKHTVNEILDRSERESERVRESGRGVQFLKNL